jgi:hypothetical protein
MASGPEPTVKLEREVDCLEPQSSPTPLFAVAARRPRKIQVDPFTTDLLVGGGDGERRLNPATGALTEGPGLFGNQVEFSMTFDDGSAVHVSVIGDWAFVDPEGVTTSLPADVQLRDVDYVGGNDYVGITGSGDLLGVGYSPESGVEFALSSPVIGVGGRDDDLSAMSIVGDWAVGVVEDPDTRAFSLVGIQGLTSPTAPTFLPLPGGMDVTRDDLETNEVEISCTDTRGAALFATCAVAFKQGDPAFFSPRIGRLFVAEVSFDAGTARTLVETDDAVAGVTWLEEEGPRRRLVAKRQWDTSVGVWDIQDGALAASGSVIIPVPEGGAAIAQIISGVSPGVLGIAYQFESPLEGEVHLFGTGAFLSLIF